ncbi:MAG: hypothetical protein ACPLSJ_00835 [Thermosulfidibacteraceae bacterium]|jgi:Tfp pilus assembly protein PilP
MKANMVTAIILIVICFGTTFAQNPFTAPFDEERAPSTSIGAPGKGQSGKREEVDFLTSWKVVGIMKRDGEKFAMIDLSDGRVVVVREGSLVDKKYRILRIEDNSVIVYWKGKKRRIVM